MHGPKNLFCSSGLLRAQPQDIVALQDIVAAVVQRNVCWAHSEIISLALHADQDPNIQQRAIDMECRSEADNDLRPYHIPSISFHVTDYTDLIDWSTQIVAEPPLNWHVEASQLSVIGDEIPAYPVHTQVV